MSSTGLPPPLSSRRVADLDLVPLSRIIGERSSPREPASAIVPPSFPSPGEGKGRLEKENDNAIRIRLTTNDDGASGLWDPQSETRGIDMPAAGTAEYSATELRDGLAGDGRGREGETGRVNDAAPPGRVAFNCCTRATFVEGAAAGLRAAKKHNTHRRSARARARVCVCTCREFDLPAAYCRDGAYGTINNAREGNFPPRARGTSAPSRFFQLSPSICLSLALLLGAGCWRGGTQ